MTLGMCHQWDCHSCSFAFADPIEHSVKQDCHVIYKLKIQHIPFSPLETVSASGKFDPCTHPTIFLREVLGQIWKGLLIARPKFMAEDVVETRSILKRGRYLGPFLFAYCNYFLIWHWNILIMRHKSINYMSGAKWKAKAVIQVSSPVSSLA